MTKLDLRESMHKEATIGKVPNSMENQRQIQYKSYLNEKAVS